MELRTSTPYGSRQSAASIPVGDVHELNDLGALVADRKVSNGTQIRSSHGNWKLKPAPGTSARSLKHARDAVTMNEALFSKALAKRQCSATPSDLLKLLRPAASGQLSAGDLRRQLHALAMLDVAMGPGPQLSPASACSLVLTALLDELAGDEAQAIGAVKHAAGFMKSQNMSSEDAWRAACAVFFKTSRKDEKSRATGT